MLWTILVILFVLWILGFSFRPGTGKTRDHILNIR